MELRDFRRGRHLFSPGRPSRLALANILGCIYFINRHLIQGRTQWDIIYYKGICTPSRNMPTLDTTDAEYVANLVHVNMWLQTCNAAVYCIDLVCTLNHKKRDILFLTITLANLNRFL